MGTQFNPWQLLSPSIVIAEAIATDVGELEAGQSATVPPVRTYLGPLHVEIDITIRALPAS